MAEGTRLWRYVSLFLLLALAMLPGMARGADDGQTRVKASQLVKSVVLINTFSCDQPPRAGAPSPVPFQGQRCNAAFWKGSGSVIDGQGRLLTNDHVIRPDRHGSAVDPATLGWYLIYLTTDAKELPVPSFYARPIAASAELDLAILEPAWTLDGQPIEGGRVDGLPMLPLAQEAGTVDIEDTLRLLGYPREHPLVTVSTVQVVGFEDDRRVPELGTTAWIRTDVASAGPGNSGGPAVNDNGQQVGVVSAGSRNQLDCRDYDGDGVIDPVSECVTAAGGSEYVRPVPEALALLEGAVSPEPEPIQTPPAPPEEPTEPPAPPEEPTEPPAPPEEPTEPPAPPEEPTATLAPTPTVEPTPTEVPPGPTPDAGTAIVIGTLVSADTGDAIARGQIVVLQPGIMVRDWKRGRVGEEAIYAWVLTDARGFFQLPVPVVRGERYSVWIQAAGYEELFKDQMVLATENDPAIVDLGTIKMPLQV